MCEQRHDIHISKTESTLLWCPADNCIIVYWSYNWDILRHMCTYHHYQPSSSSSSYYYTIDSYPSPTSTPMPSHPVATATVVYLLDACLLERAQGSIRGASRKSALLGSSFSYIHCQHGIMEGILHFLLFLVFLKYPYKARPMIYRMYTHVDAQWATCYKLKTLDMYMNHIEEKNLSIHAQLWCL